MESNRCTICDWSIINNPGEKREFYKDVCSECLGVIEETLKEWVPEAEEEGAATHIAGHPQNPVVASNLWEELLNEIETQRRA